MSKIFLWIGSAFVAFGLLFAGIGGYTYIADQQMAETALRAPGTVIALDRRRGSEGGTTYAPVVEWTDRDGTRHEFTSSTSSSPASFSRGEAVTVMYDPAKPGQAKIDSFGQRFMLPLVFGGMGSLFAILGAVFVFLFLRRKKTVERLKLSGIRIEAEVTRCELDRSIKVNSRSPYRVHAQATHPGTGKLASFKSDPIWLDLSKELDGKTVPVLIDPNAPKQHYIDLSQWVDDSEKA
ncbi:DUF3592 domain-containing protein [Erythrobacter sp. W53]|uniref:DUF3592 domain-containing protein n=1 Tax=Erythrobacter sp. W53 TaxID=3425947 RepID=UPI003D768EC3